VLDTKRSGRATNTDADPAIRMVNEDVELLSSDPIEGH